MPNLGGGSAQPQTDAVHNCAVLHAHLQPEYSRLRRLRFFGSRTAEQAVSSYRLLGDVLLCTV